LPATGGVSVGSVSSVASRAPEMLFPALGGGQSDRRNVLAVQRSTRGAGAAASRGPDEAAAQNAALSTNDRGTEPQEVHLLANEVWMLLRNRLRAEKERMGFALRSG